MRSVGYLRPPGFPVFDVDQSILIMTMRKDIHFHENLLFEELNVFAEAYDHVVQLSCPRLRRDCQIEITRILSPTLTCLFFEMVIFTIRKDSFSSFYPKLRKYFDKTQIQKRYFMK